jgi:hypothetical protein
MPFRLPAALALALVSAAALLPTAASAATYRLAYEGEVEYRQVRETEDGAYKETTTANFWVSGRADDIDVVDGRLYGAVSIRDVRVGGARSARVSTTDGGTNKSCNGSTVTTTAPGMLFPGAPVYGWPPFSAALLPFFGVDLAMRCTDSDGRTFEEAVLITNGSPQGRRALPTRFHVRIDMPKGEDGGEGLVWPMKRTDTSRRNCPGGGDYYTRVCTTVLDGKVRFLRVREEERRAPRTPGGGGGGGGLRSVAPAVLGRATLSPDARRAQVKVRCITGCKARVRIFTPKRAGGRRGKASAAAPLAARTLELAPGRTSATAITVALDAAAQRAVRTAGGALVEVTLEPPVGGTVRRSLAASLG